MEEAYGFEFKPLSEDDREKFERYVQLANAKLSDVSGDAQRYKK